MPGNTTDTMFTKDFDYYLPEELIASYPEQKRDQSRMLVIDRATQSIRHCRFSELPSFLQPQDLLVLNDTKVLPSRFFSNDHKIELVRTERLSATSWRCMVRPGKKMREGKSVQLGAATGTVRLIDEQGERIIDFDRVPDEALGELALPHYMQRSSQASDVERYQTVYANKEGAIAAPTAGLHFTDEMLSGLNHCFVTLHVGVGTFRPVKAERIEEHVMHSENYLLEEQAARRINEAPRRVAIGTTVVRVLEHVAAKQQGPPLHAESGSTNIFIYPPYRFRAVDALLTNFHLPQSTLLMLVSAFAGKELVMEAYRQAVEQRYRFFSYGDCMLIL